MPAPGERTEDESEEGSIAGEDKEGRGRVASAVVDVGEMPASPGMRNVTDKGKGRASDELRTAMEAMEVMEVGKKAIA